MLAIVAEQTGYPPDLLDMDLDLEADLGIDTVKQAEVFATIREAYGIERDDSLKLRDYPTLNHVVGFVHERSGAAGARARPPAPAPAAAAPEPAARPPARRRRRARVLAIVAEQTGYPPDLLDMDLDLEADLGIDTVKQAEVFATIREAYGIERDDSLKLRDYPTLNHVVAFVNERSGAAAPRPGRPQPAARPGAPSPLRARRAAAASSSGCWRSSPSRPAIRPTCSTWTSTSRPTSGSTRSSRPRSSPTIREAYGIERDDSLKLRDYPTLNHVVAFVNERVRRRGAAPAPAAAAARGARPPARRRPVRTGFLRRVPVAVVRPPLDRCVATGVELGEGSRVVLMPDRGGVGAALAKALAKLGVEVLEIDGEPDSRSARRADRRRGRPRARSRASTGCRHSTTRDRCPRSIPPPGARACACA